MNITEIFVCDTGVTWLFIWFYYVIFRSRWITIVEVIFFESLRNMNLEKFITEKISYRQWNHRNIFILYLNLMCHVFVIEEIVFESVKILLESTVFKECAGSSWHRIFLSSNDRMKFFMSLTQYKNGICFIKHTKNVIICWHWNGMYFFM